MQNILSEIASSTMQSIGTPFLAALVKSMRGAMEATLVFITTGIGTPPLRAHSMASWQENGIKDAFEYDLEGTPCRLVYKGEALIISEGLYKRFPRETGFEGYVGVPPQEFTWFGCGTFCSVFGKTVGQAFRSRGHRPAFCNARRSRIAANRT